jgi:hypothetical protein
MRELLFEIKPDSSKASFYMGLGQLLLYRRDVRECQSFLVVPEDSPEDCLTEEWRTEFREREIGFVTYKTRGSNTISRNSQFKYAPGCGKRLI